MDLKHSDALLSKPALEVRHSKGVSSIFFSPFSEIPISDRDFVFLDSNLQHLNLDRASSNVFVFEANEDRKSLATVEELADWLAEHGANRRSRLLAIGGGIVQDVATLASSIFMRGIEWRYVPTTTNSMLDSCVGGKSAINTKTAKNLVGNFYPPNEVHIDSGLLQTLSKVDYFGGLLEGLKIMFASGAKHANSFIEDLKSQDFSLTDELIMKSLDAKARIVEEDEFDNGKRLLLNFGHTFGHALESATGFRTPHGVAVGLGMLAANSLLETYQPELERLNAAIAEILRQIPPGSLPRTADVEWSTFQTAILADKKHSSEHLRFIAPLVNGELGVLEMPKSEDALTKVTLALKEKLID